MAPDLNSLPPSRSPSSAMSRALSSSGDSANAAARSQTPSPVPRSASNSLQAAATVNAGLQQEDSRRSPTSTASRNRQSSHAGSRRRSTVLASLQLNDPSLPPPAEILSQGQAVTNRASPQSLASSPLGDPHHNRAPSLGELHQELEQENEAQVNRLLQQIRIQQQQLLQLQASNGQTPGPPPVIDEYTPTSERSMSFSYPAGSNAPQSSAVTSGPRSPSGVIHPRSSFDVARADLVQRRSRTPSRTASPRLRSPSISGEAEHFSLAGRDESAFYQAETQMMIRENQMLRQRIRELERQVTELHANSSATHEPAAPSHLLSSASVSESRDAVPRPSNASPSTEVKNE